MNCSTRSLAASFALAVIVLHACGGGGGTGAARTAPTIANLELAPRVVYQDPAPSTFSVGFDLFDPNRDVASASFVLRDAGGLLVDQRTLAIAATAATVRIQGAAVVPLPQLGTFTVEIWTTDAGGLISNALTTTVDVVPYPWTSMPADLVVRRDAAAVALDEQVYVIGGSRQDLGMFPGPTTPIVARFDPATATWAEMAPLAVSRSAFAAAVVDGRILAIGGLSRPPLSGSFLVATVEQYDPATNVWSPRASLPTARHRIAAATLGGRVYVVGGLTGSEFEPLATVESYDPVADTWRAEPSLLHSRHGARAAAFGGRLVVAGGERSPGVCENRVEVFDPATGLWTTTPDANLCATWLVATAGQLFAGAGEGLWASLAANPPVWSGRTSNRLGSSLESAVAATSTAIFVFGEYGVERYVLAHEIH